MNITLPLKYWEEDQVTRILTDSTKYMLLNGKVKTPAYSIYFKTTGVIVEEIIPKTIFSEGFGEKIHMKTLYQRSYDGIKWQSTIDTRKLKMFDLPDKSIIQ